jgi:hypothetical protein
MTDMGQHSTTAAPRRDHLWVLVIIAACALLEVWASWIAIGSMSGFPRLGGSHGLPTDWTLAVTTEAYWGYALYSWLAAAPGPRSRGFAMWSAIAVFVLSLTGQGAAHLVKPGTEPPAPLVVFVTALPVLVLALIAILVHLRQADREAIETEAHATAEAERLAALERAEADERTALRVEVTALREQLGTALADLGTAQSEAARALAKADRLTAQIAAAGAPAQRRPKALPKRPAAHADKLEQETNLLRAQMEIQDDPSLAAPRMGGELARRLGLGASTGRRLHGILTESGRLRAEYERSAEPDPVSDSGER